MSLSKKLNFINLPGLDGSDAAAETCDTSNGGDNDNGGDTDNGGNGKDSSQSVYNTSSVLAALFTLMLTLWRV